MDNNNIGIYIMFPETMNKLTDFVNIIEANCTDIIDEITTLKEELKRVKLITSTSN